eukprot:tig00000025_g7930.t1
MSVSHAAEKLVDSKLAPLQRVPAFIFYNNGRSFSNDNFNSWRSPGHSDKAKRKNQIGQWGLGSKCIYHITDAPGVVSSRSLAICDPHAFFITRRPDAQGRIPMEGSIRIRDLFKADEKGVRPVDKYADQLASFRLVLDDGTVCDPRDPNLSGALFRISARTSEREGGVEVVRSRISKQTFTGEDLLKLLAEFESEAARLLCFLPHVETVRPRSL